MGFKRSIILFFVLLITSVFLNGEFSFAKQDSLEINFFYSATCPHCAAEKEFLKEIEIKYSEIEIKEYEVIHNTENQKILENFYEKYQVPAGERGWVPVTFTPTKYFIGFSEQIGQGIEGCIKECLVGEKPAAQKIKIPILGEVDISRMSLPVLTVILGTLDGFNPCAMWVLVILISLSLALKSRKKIALVGGTFILAEGLLYFLFMAAWLNAFLAMKYVFWVRLLIGVFGIGFGIWRIRDFIIWKPGICKVVEHSKSQGKLLEKIKSALRPSTVPATILGVIALAFGVNLVEFFCSAGFPVIYTQILTLQGLGTVQYYLYLAFYNFFYMLDDFVVFGFAFLTLNRFGFSNKYNRYSTLIAGILIFILGILLILKPGWLMFA
jgi:glutaredoxin